LSRRFFGLVLYFIFSGLSYAFVFDKETMKHPKFLKNQVWLEMKQANTSMPWMSAMTMPFFLAEIRGYTKLYDMPSDGPGLWYEILQYPFFLMFTDLGIYWIHRGLHHPLVYKHLHKPHHKWIMPTPFASYAFHPVDGFFQSVPYHVFPILFPQSKYGYVAMFIFINFWTILIHDGEYISNNPVVNGSACHAMHHLYFNYNYGQYFTLWDRLGGSYRKPNEELFQKDKKMSQTEWKRQINEMERVVKEVEGEDDRHYDPVVDKKTK
jgi:Delta7-sterol 5-desaturase